MKSREQLSKDFAAARYTLVGAALVLAPYLEEASPIIISQNAQAPFLKAVEDYLAAAAEAAESLIRGTS